MGIFRPSKSHIAGQLTRLTPRIVFNWNYTTCPDPVIAGEVSDDGDIMPCVFTGPNGEHYGGTLCAVGAFGDDGQLPGINGSPVTPDTATTAAGLDVQMDIQTTDNVGIQLIPGAGALGGPSALTVGTHSGYIDVTFFTPDWQDFDCAVIGYRKVEAFQTGYNAVAAAGSTGDVVYHDVAGFGVMTDTDLRIQTVKDNGANATLTDAVSKPVDAQNLRLRVTVSSAGAVTYSFVVNQVAGAGTLAAPATTAAFSFNNGDVIVPFIATLGCTVEEDSLFIKDIEVQKSPGTSFVN